MLNYFKKIIGKSNFPQNSNTCFNVLEKRRLKRQRDINIFEKHVNHIERLKDQINRQPENKPKSASKRPNIQKTSKHERMEK